VDDAGAEAHARIEEAVRRVETWADELLAGRGRRRVDRGVAAAREAAEGARWLLAPGTRARAIRELRVAAARESRACRTAARRLSRAGRDPPRWTVHLEGLGGTLLGLWGGEEPFARVFAVGADDGAGPLFLSWREGGDAWERIGALPPGVDLWWVTEVPGDAVYACGSSGSVVRHDPATGAVADLGTEVDAILFGIWGSGPGDLWTVGGDPAGVGPRPVLLHHDGASWTPFAAPPGSEDRILFKVWGTAADDVWACGDAGLLLHFDGEVWESIPSGTATVLVTVHGPAPRTAVGGGASAVVLEEGPGGAWAPVPVPPALPALIGVWVPGGGAPAHAAGALATCLRRDAPGAWSRLRGCPVTGLDFHSAWVDREGNALFSGGRLSDLSEGLLVSRGSREFPSVVRGAGVVAAGAR
jgi:hypothetical protein